MEAILAERADIDGGRPRRHRAAPDPKTADVVVQSILDPLDDDDAADEMVLTTRRAITRVALVAAETGGRFQREAVECDPMAWLTAPRRVFDGRAAIDACLGRDECMRGILVHGLGLGLDVDRSCVDALLAGDDDDDDIDSHAFRHAYGDALGGGPRKGRGRPGRSTRLRLYTATLADTRDNVLTQAFHASVARSAGEVRARLAGRFGPDLADVADIRLGVHAAMPLVVALVPAAVLELIQRMERETGTPLGRTFAVDIQQCIQA